MPYVPRPFHNARILRSRLSRASGPGHARPQAPAPTVRESLEWVRAERNDLRAHRDAQRAEHRDEIQRHRRLVDKLAADLAHADSEIELRGKEIERQAEQAALALAEARDEIERRGTLIEKLGAGSSESEDELRRCHEHIERLEHILGVTRGHRLFKWMKRLRLA